MNKERLLKLADFLEKKVPPEKFDLSEWKKKKPECGYAACAVGWACSVRAFRQEGLVMLKKRHRGFAGQKPYFTYSPAYDGVIAWCAVCRFFDVGMTTAMGLFHKDHYAKSPLPADVAERIRGVVAATEEEEDS